MRRASWRTVTAIIGRVVNDLAGSTDRLEGVRRIGIDEIAHRKGHRYLTVVVDHDTGRLIWAAPGRDSKTVLAFFDALGPQREGQLTHVSADGAEWIHGPVRAQAPQAVLCLEAFHVVAWATKALDQVCGDVWNELRAAGRYAQANCAAIVDRLTFGGNIIETGTSSYRLAHARNQRTPNA